MTELTREQKLARRATMEKALGFVSMNDENYDDIRAEILFGGSDINETWNKIEANYFPTEPTAEQIALSQEIENEIKTWTARDEDEEN